MVRGAVGMFRVVVESVVHEFAAHAQAGIDFTIQERPAVPQEDETPRPAQKATKAINDAIPDRATYSAHKIELSGESLRKQKGESLTKAAGAG